MPISVNTSNIKTNQFLSNFAVQYNNDAFRGMELAPSLLVIKESDKYKEFVKDGYFSGAPIRNDGAMAEEASHSYINRTYTTYQRALKEFITDRAIRNADSVFKLKTEAVQFVTDKIKLSKELDVASVLTGTTGGISAADPDHVVTPSNLWSDPTNSTPEDDITDGKEAITKQIGRLPNKLLISPIVEKFLGRHSKIEELRKYTDKSGLTEGGVPSRLWGLDVIVAPSIFNQAEEGKPIDMAYVWGKNAIIAYVNPGDTVTLARTFVLRSGNFVVDEWRDKEREGVFVRAKTDYICKVICPECGYLLSDVVA